MLVKFAIDPQSLFKFKAQTTLSIQFERLLEKWENYGILVNTDQIEENIDCFEPNIRDQIEEIFEQSDLKTSPPRYRLLEGERRVIWEDLDDNNIGILSDYSEVFDLAIIEETLALEIKVLESPLSPDTREAICGTVEPIGHAIADRALSWSRASAVSRRGFEEGDNYMRLWNEHFKRLTEFSSQVVIIDAYALHDRQFDGFVKLLQFIDKDGKACRVTLFSSPAQDNDRSVQDNDRSVKKIRERLSYEVGRLSGGGIKQVTIRLLPLDKQEHDRHIRFDRTIYKPQNSFALVFSGEDGNVPQSVGCSLQLSDDEYHPFDDLKKVENELINKAKNLRWLASEQDYMVLFPNSSASS